MESISQAFQRLPRSRKVRVIEKFVDAFLEEIGSLTVEAFKNNIDNAEDWANAISSEWVAKKAKGGFETDILKMTLKLRESINHRVVSSKGIKELKYTWSRKASNGKLKGTDISDFIIAARDFTFIPKDLLQGGATYEQVWGKHMQRLRDDIIAMAK